MDLSKFYEEYGIDVCSYMKYRDTKYDYSNKITFIRDGMINRIRRRISYDEELKYKGRYNCLEYHELVLSKFDEYTNEILSSETGKELQMYLKSIEKTAITYAELYSLLHKYEEKYETETNKKNTFIKEFIEHKILPKYNIIVYDVLSLIRMNKSMFQDEKLIRRFNLNDNNIKQLSDPPEFNLSSMIEKNDNAYQYQKIQEEIKWKQDHGFLPKNDGTQYYPKKKTAPTLAEGWCIYILLMIVVSIFHSRVFGWIAITIFFLIWRKLEIDKFN